LRTLTLIDDSDAVVILSIVRDDLRPQAMQIGVSVLRKVMKVMK